MNDNMQIAAQMNPAQSGIFNFGSFSETIKAAEFLSNSNLVPAQYRSMTEGKGQYGKGNGQFTHNPNAAANCLIALNMANRMGADPLMIMQNLYLIEGRPAWSSQFIIAAINSCGRFTALRFEFKELGERDVTYNEVSWLNGNKQNNNKTVRINDFSCVAWATEKATGERIESSPITMDLAIKEGWYGKSGSKWQTMDRQMAMYRAAAFFGRIYAPELLMGIQTKEEIDDISEPRNVTATAIRSPSPINASVNALLETLPNESIIEYFDITALLAEIEHITDLDQVTLVGNEIKAMVSNPDIVIKNDDINELRQALGGKKKQVVTATEYQNIMQQINDCQDLETAERLKSVINNKAGDFGEATQTLYDKLEIITEEIGAQG